MRLSSRGEYFILSLSPEMIRGARFKRKGQKYRVAAFFSAVSDPGDPAEAVRNVLREISYRQDAVLILTGALADGEFFRIDGDPALLPKDRRAALEFELSRHLLKVPAEPHFEFAVHPCANGDASKCIVSVYVFGSFSIDRLAALLTQSKARADEFISPLLCIKDGEGAAYMPDLEKDYVFTEGEWRSVSGIKIDNACYHDTLSQMVEIPSAPDFDFDGFLPVLLALRFINSDYAGNETSVRAIPPKLRPSRYKLHLAISVVLILLLGGFYLSGAIRERVGRYRENRDLVAELNNCRKKTSKLQNEYKAGEKDRKELERVLKMNPGMTNAISIFENLTNLLPKDVMATYIRFGDSTIDLTLQTESSNPNLQQTLRAMEGWKVSQYNQRTVNDTVTMITLRLTREEPSVKDREKSK